MSNIFAFYFSDSVHDFLCYQNIPSIVWGTIDDGDSYVRASAIHVIGLLACQSQLWSSLLKIGRVTEVLVKSYLIC